MKNIKVIFFDMGNTLLHFHYGQSDDEKDIQGLVYLTEYLNRFDENITFEDVKNNFYKIWMDGIKDRKSKRIEYPIESFLNGFLKKYDLTFSLEQCIQAIHCFYKEYREQVRFEDNIYETLKSIKEKGYKIGVISNTCYYDEVMKECFSKAKIYELVDNFIFSYSLKIGKPNKKIFEAAIEQMGISPKEAIMVGDSLESDIKPALQLGMKTIWLKNDIINDTKLEIVPHGKISTIKELLSYI
ncbi:HAD family hydrolase [Clostridium sp. ATCC 25772]|uniref:HAD family hydrolase n=1 Tax=Clostridium sp. ATCC 25772 TaxID=1676991 RepID=UPI00078463A1|nr:HAD family hydrolase [Clostridium sp. ATCC 25772]